MHVHLCVASCLFSPRLSFVLYFVPPFSFQPFLMFTSALNERSRSNPLCDFRLGTVVTSDYETLLTRRVGPPKGGAPKGGAPKGWGPERWGPKISRFFFPLPPQFFVLFSLSFGLFRGILVVFEAPGRSNVHVWSSRAVVCEPRRPGLVGPPGFHTTTREPNRAHQGPGLQKHHQNSTKRTNKRGRKE